MSNLKFHMFGKFDVYAGDQLVDCFRCQKAFELFCYLMIFREQPLHRDQLAEIFWGQRSTVDAKKYLRKTIWQLQSALNELPVSTSSNLLRVENDWLQIDQQADFYLDIREFEEVYTHLAGIRGRDFDPRDFQAAQDAASLYRGGLLEGCYQEWCIFERERLQDMYFGLLDKLTDYCEAHKRYENGIVYGKILLGLDRAREGTHLRLMRLYYLSGDRTAALRQFEACQAALEQEFNIRPGARTLEMHQKICNDELDGLVPGPDSIQKDNDSSLAGVRESLRGVKELLTIQASMLQEIAKEIQSTKKTISELEKHK